MKRLRVRWHRLDTWEKNVTRWSTYATAVLSIASIVIYGRPI